MNFVAKWPLFFLFIREKKFNKYIQLTKKSGQVARSVFSAIFNARFNPSVKTKNTERNSENDYDFDWFNVSTLWRGGT